MKSQFGPINLKMHAINDLIALVFTLVSPWLLGYSDNVLATWYAVAMFMGGMGINLISDYPLGLVKLVPMKMHRMVEFTTPGIFIVVPWVFFRDAGAMPWALTAAGVLIVLNSLFTREITAAAETAKA